MSSSGLPMADTKTLPTSCLESIHHPKRASVALDHGRDPQKCVHCQHIIACEIAVVCPPPDTAFATQARPPCRRRSRVRSLAAPPICLPCRLPRRGFRPADCLNKRLYSFGHYLKNKTAINTSSRLLFALTCAKSMIRPAPYQRGRS
jgi:hypothetical protein